MDELQYVLHRADCIVQIHSHCGLVPAMESFGYSRIEIRALKRKHKEPWDKYTERYINTRRPSQDMTMNIP